MRNVHMQTAVYRQATASLYHYSYFSCNSHYRVLQFTTEYILKRSHIYSQCEENVLTAENENYVGTCMYMYIYTYVIVSSSSPSVDVNDCLKIIMFTYTLALLY